ncbi:hypothetical protein FLA105534_04622 [Flavobacterium bizetiae]|jgi:hypothetical protein|uniref:Uncharacterized protein n=1 Tax=Flavobacterium bizetiae TaxID=2704140 RepID=A0A6J4GX00_9FLAO|nr:hypothetical protein FLA105534_04622 [Flavobacterium bizetiae]CAD5342388.1 hypothetical protein FLA105535_02374 [Flavobacterium bizetiae]CAD5348304.1 hypothetical protein FLA105534_02265 [Flavobacterium bizetiae]
MIKKALNYQRIQQTYKMYTDKTIENLQLLNG